MNCDGFAAASRNDICVWFYSTALRFKRQGEHRALPFCTKTIFPPKCLQHPLQAVSCSKLGAERAAGGMIQVSFAVTGLEKVAGDEKTARNFKTVQSQKN